MHTQNNKKKEISNTHTHTHTHTKLFLPRKTQTHLLRGNNYKYVLFRNQEIKLQILVQKERQNLQILKFEKECFKNNVYSDQYLQIYRLKVTSIYKLKYDEFPV